MTKKEIAKQSLNRKIEEYEKYRKFKDKEEADNTYRTLEAQIKLAKEVNLINTVMTMEYLSRLQKRYSQILQSEQFREYRDQVLNFNDDVITDKERLYTMQQQEKKNSYNLRMTIILLLKNTFAFLLLHLLVDHQEEKVLSLLIMCSLIQLKQAFLREFQSAYCFKYFQKCLNKFYFF